jgi:hypothetical protein
MQKQIQIQIEITCVLQCDKTVSLISPKFKTESNEKNFYCRNSCCVLFCDCM